MSGSLELTLKEGRRVFVLSKFGSCMGRILLEIYHSISLNLLNKMTMIKNDHCLKDRVRLLRGLRRRRWRWIGGCGGGLCARRLGGGGEGKGGDAVGGGGGGGEGGKGGEEEVEGGRGGGGGKRGGRGHGRVRRRNSGGRYRLCLRCTVDNNVHG